MTQLADDDHPTIDMDDNEDSGGVDAEEHVRCPIVDDIIRRWMTVLTTHVGMYECLVQLEYQEIQLTAVGFLDLIIINPFAL